MSHCKESGGKGGGWGQRWSRERAERMEKRRVRRNATMAYSFPLSSAVNSYLSWAIL